jgi:hypothetical protein
MPQSPAPVTSLVLLALFTASSLLRGADAALPPSPAAAPTVQFATDAPRDSLTEVRSFALQKLANSTVNASDLDVTGPFACYYYDFGRIRNSIPGPHPQGFWYYLVTYAGRPVAQVAVQKNIMGNHADPITHDEDPRLLADALAAAQTFVHDHPGSYEARLLSFYSITALWLKPASGGDDRLFPVTLLPGVFHRGEMYSMGNFTVGACTPFAIQFNGSSPYPFRFYSLAEMNAFFTDRFIASYSFGKGRMTLPPMDTNPSMRFIEDPAGNVSFGIDSLQLIGIARHSPPVAFTIRIHALSTDGKQNFGLATPADIEALTHTRPLTDFEQQALLKFAAGQNLVIQKSTAGSLVVVGAIRANESCLECHALAKVGDVLGAFTYRLSYADSRPQVAP